MRFKILQSYKNEPFGEASEPKFNTVCFRRLFGGPALDILISSQSWQRNCARKQKLTQTQKQTYTKNDVTNLSFPAHFPQSK